MKPAQVLEAHSLMGNIRQVERILTLLAEQDAGSPTPDGDHAIGRGMARSLTGALDISTPAAKSIRDVLRVDFTRARDALLAQLKHLGIETDQLAAGATIPESLEEVDR